MATDEGGTARPRGGRAGDGRALPRLLPAPGRAGLRVHHRSDGGTGRGPGGVRPGAGPAAAAWPTWTTRRPGCARSRSTSSAAAGGAASCSTRSCCATGRWPGSSSRRPARSAPTCATPWRPCPSTYREVVVLHYFADLPVDEIAAAAGGAGRHGQVAAVPGPGGARRAPRRLPRGAVHAAPALPRLVGGEPCLTWTSSSRAPATTCSTRSRSPRWPPCGAGPAPCAAGSRPCAPAPRRSRWPAWRSPWCRASPATARRRSPRRRWRRPAPVYRGDGITINGLVRLAAAAAARRHARRRRVRRPDHRVRAVGVRRRVPADRPDDRRRRDLHPGRPCRPGWAASSTWSVSPAAGWCW